MKLRLFCIATCVLSLLKQVTSAHEDFTSSVALNLQSDGIVATILVSAGDLAREIPSLEAKMLLDAAILKREEASIANRLRSRLLLATESGPLTWDLRSVTPEPVKEDVRLEVFFATNQIPMELHVTCGLFPEEPIHRTFLTVSRNDSLLRQETFDGPPKLTILKLQEPRGRFQTAIEFVWQGMHHIFIGIDHILFVLGLMLLGGTVKRLLLVTTAFTLAHSLTLVLASLKIFTPPPEIVEPAIALSIVVIGVHAFLHRGKADHRISLAFVLGLLHGFGFAGVLQDLNLPTDAFAISLAGFNIGVELGQAVILLVTVPTMALMFKKLPRQATIVVSTATLAIITVGSYWFVERIL